MIQGKTSRIHKELYHDRCKNSLCSIFMCRFTHRLFPNTLVVTELSQTSNMRFMQFTAQEAGALKASKLEQVSKMAIRCSAFSISFVCPSTHLDLVLSILGSVPYFATLKVHPMSIFTVFY